MRLKGGADHSLSISWHADGGMCLVLEPGYNINHAHKTNVLGSFCFRYSVPTLITHITDCTMHP